MSDNAPIETPASPDKARPTAASADGNPWSSSIYRLCEEIIALREMNNRQHKVFEKELARSREALQASFNSFSSDTQQAHQRLRKEIHGEKRVSLTLLQELLDIGFDLEGIVRARPKEAEELSRWADAVEVQHRKVQAALDAARHPSLRRGHWLGVQSRSARTRRQRPRRRHGPADHRRAARTRLRQRAAGIRAPPAESDRYGMSYPTMRPHLVLGHLVGEGTAEEPAADGHGPSVNDRDRDDARYPLREDLPVR